MAVTLLFVFLTVAGLATGRNFHLQNNLGYTVWVGIQGNAGLGQPNNGGFTLYARHTRTVQIHNGWKGRFWARTDCKFDSSGDGECTTGHCVNGLECNGAGVKPPATLAEITLNGENGRDVYYVSLVNGFNIPIQIIPTVGGGSGYYCTTAGCSTNLNPGCPDNLKVLDGGIPVACKSSCLADNTDEYCCRGAFKDPNVCKRSPSAKHFDYYCPRTYSYPFNDGTSFFNCHNTDYKIMFG